MAAARRAYWKGYLKLSLVTCPIALYPASSDAEKTHFHQINRETGNRLRQRLVDEETGRVVDKENKGRGYEISKGKYVAIEPEEINAIQVESTHTLDIEKFVPVDEIDRRYFDRPYYIEKFVPVDEIDRRYFDRPYYIVPDGRAGEEAFAVIRDAMKDKSRVALARIVLANRERVMAIEPFGKIMLGTVLRYDYEVRDEKELARSAPSPRVPKEMISLASHILDAKAGHFDPSDFKDQFELELRKLVKRKAAGKTIEAPARAERPANMIDLMDALRQSLGKRGKCAAALRPSSPSKATSKLKPRKPPAWKRKTKRAA